MRQEQLKVFYDIDRIAEINEKIEQIRNDNSLDQTAKESAVIAVMEALDDDEKREFEHYIRTVASELMPVKNEYVGQAKLKDKYVLMEIQSMQPSYHRANAFFTMISYMLARLDSYKNEEDKPAVQRFMQEVFGGTSDKYMGTLYDMFYTENKAKHPSYIPDIPVDILGDCMPSIDQWHNFTKYADAKYHEARALTSAILGYRSSQESIVHIHGIFDSPTDPELTAYRIENADKMSPVADLVPFPIGKTVLYDKYKEYRSGTVLFNPSDPDLEILHTNRVTTDMNNHAMFKKRLNSLEGRMSKQDMQAYNKYTKEIEKLRRAPPKSSKPLENKLAVLNRKKEEILEKYTNEDEVITNVIEFDRNKGKVSTSAFATKAD